MNIKEYTAQKALGTLDYIKAAISTLNSDVLASIVEDTMDRDVHMVVAMNIKTDCKTLTRLIIERDMPDAILDVCIWHPSVTLKLLENWHKRPYMASRNSLRTRMNALQTVTGVPKRKRTKIAEDTTYSSGYLKILEDQQNQFTSTDAIGWTHGSTTTTTTIPSPPIDNTKIYYGSSMDPGNEGLKKQQEQLAQQCDSLKESKDKLDNFRKVQLALK